MRRIEREKTDDVERKAEERGEDWQIKLSCFSDLILKIFLFVFFFISANAQMSLMPCPSPLVSDTSAWSVAVCSHTCVLQGASHFTRTTFITSVTRLDVASSFPKPDQSTTV